MRGFHEATTDEQQIRAWWAETPNANLATVPGKAGMVVIDLDGPEADGEAQALGLFSQPTMYVLTPRGQHLYFQHPGGFITNVKLSPHIDVRADAGYVLVPPSIHPSGERYRAEQKGLDLFPLPPKVQALIAAGGISGAAPATPRELPDILPEGQRNAMLTSLAGSARRRGASQEAILAMLQAENLGRCRPQLEDRELERVAASVARYTPESSPPTDQSPAPTEDGTPELETKVERNRRIAEAAIAAMGSQQRVSSWGWRDFDRSFGPLIAGWLYVVGARPGNGKTTLLLNLLSRLWEDRVPTFYFGTEMSADELVRKWAALRLRYDELRTFSDDLTPDEKDELRREFCMLLESDTVTFSTFTRLDIGRIGEEIRWAFDQHTGRVPKVVVLDHIHRVAQEREEVAALVQELKTIAIERRVVMLVASQLNRDGGLFDLYTPPHMGRNKGSSAIEENADVGIGLFRPLVRGVSMKQRRAAEQGDIEAASLAQVNVLAAICSKHRYRGAAVNRTASLVVNGSRLESRAYQHEQAPVRDTDEVPFSVATTRC